jgi:hypothetical protein
MFSFSLIIQYMVRERHAAFSKKLEEDKNFDMTYSVDLYRRAELF